MKKPCVRSLGESSILAVGIDYVNLRKRSELDRNATRKNIENLIKSAFDAIFPGAGGCRFQDTHGGIDALFPPGVSKSDLLTEFLPELERGLEQHNSRCSAATMFRLRAVFHAGADSSAPPPSAVAGSLLGSNYLRMFVMALPKERSVAVLVSDEFHRRTAAPRPHALGQGLKRARIQTEERVPVTVWAYRYPESEA